ncbi:MAG: hypothetical protein AAB870_05010, partial [Patescibacteria group bacterium]
GKPVYDMAFAKAQKGKILIQVQRGGAAWYINPANLKAYYLGKPADALNVMRMVGVGVNNNTLRQIPGFTQPASTPDKYTVRIFNVDNVGVAVVNGKTYTTAYGNTTIEDVSRVMHSGNNTIRFKMYNDTESYTWGFEVKKNGRIIFSESAGTAGKVGANDNDMTKTYQNVYDKTLTINESGLVSVNGYQASVPALISSPIVTPAPVTNDHWYIRMNNGDDKQTAVINNQFSYTTSSLGQDSGYIDITKIMHSGNNTIDFKTWNEKAGYAYGFQIKRGDTVIFDQKAGTPGTSGLYNSQNQYVYNKTVTINQYGVVAIKDNITPKPASMSRWYIRQYNGDDRQTVTVNNRNSYAIGLGQDSGFIEITDLIHAGNNSINLKAWNEMGAYTWGFQIKKDNMIVFDDKSGVVGLYGSNNNDTLRPYRFVFNKTLILNETGIIDVRDNVINQ